jgi:WsaF, C-terminal domain/WsaF, N-terminal domain
MSETSAAAPDPSLRVEDLIPVKINRCNSTSEEYRLNIVLPFICQKWSAYGGPATAFRFLEVLSPYFKYVRIISSSEKRAEFEPQQWSGWILDDGNLAHRSITFLGDDDSSLSLCPNDLFIATWWATATYIKHVIQIQAKLFAKSPQRFVYLIQDYEPGFYPWSAHYAYAEATYAGRDDTIPVFNTKLLADYFDRQGWSFAERYIFEPMLNPGLRTQSRRNTPKERRLLVYGRPIAPRNAFPLVIEGLKVLSEKFPLTPEWNVLSAGWKHDDIPLSSESSLKSLGLLGLREYAQELARCWVGLSIMISPHPSYPPLEMAEFGSWVVTNNFANKDLSQYYPNILSVSTLTPEEIADKLAWCCAQYREGLCAVVGDIPSVLRSEGDEFPFVGDLARSWRTTPT